MAAAAENRVFRRTDYFRPVKKTITISERPENREHARKREETFPMLECTEYFSRHSTIPKTMK